MAGGAGTRFWPLSRRGRPKQLLALAGGEETLLQATVRRVRPLCGDRVLIVTTAALHDAVHAAVPDLPAGRILGEPVGRNTAPCIGWGARVARAQGAERLLVVPADHYIPDADAFVATLRRALGAVDRGALVTIGVRPRGPETGYGYLEIGDEVHKGVHRVVRFVEKPDLEHARAYAASGRHLWNSGMFLFTPQAIDAAILRHLPELHQGLDAIERDPSSLGRIYPRLPAISIDYGVMEKAGEVLAVPADFHWSDVGSWSASYELGVPDAHANVARCDLLSFEAHGNLAVAPPGKVVALVGVRDLVVVDTEDALLVLPRDRAQDVRAIVEELRLQGKEDLL